MLLIEIVVPNTNTVIQQLSRLFPKVKIITHPDYIRLGGNHQWEKLITPLMGISMGDVVNSIDQKFKKLGYADIEDVSESKYEEALDSYICDIVEQAVQKFVKQLPNGWRLDSYLCSTDYDLYDPYVSITISRDIDRKSRSKRSVWYHITLTSNVNNILQQGLRPSNSTKGLILGTYRNKTFLLSPSTPIKKIKELAIHLQSRVVSDVLGAGFIPPRELQSISILSVKIPENYVKRLDYSAKHVNGIYVSEVIPPENISILYTGSPEEIRV